MVSLGSEAINVGRVTPVHYIRGTLEAAVKACQDWNYETAAFLDPNAPSVDSMLNPGPDDGPLWGRRSELSRIGGEYLSNSNWPDVRCLGSKHSTEYEVGGAAEDVGGMIGGDEGALLSPLGGLFKESNQEKQCVSYRASATLRCVGSAPESPSGTIAGPQSVTLSATAATGMKTWRGLDVMDEYGHGAYCTEYDRDDYTGRDTGYDPAKLKSAVIDRSGLKGTYTGRHFADHSDVEVGRIIALHEAHYSGLCLADAQTRRAFARDMDNLTLGAPEINRCPPEYTDGKCAYDAGEWIPPRWRCGFARAVVSVKLKYGLTVDRREVDALDSILQSCNPAPDRPVSPVNPP